MTKKIENNTENNVSKIKLAKLADFEQKIIGTKKNTENKFKPKSVKIEHNKKNKNNTEKKLEKKLEKKVEKKVEKKITNKKNTDKKLKLKKKKPRRKLLFTVCNSKKSCGEHYAPYIWERMCNENDKDITTEEFENNGITFKKSNVCQGRCKHASNIRVTEPAKDKTTQFSYMTPLKAVKLAKSLQSGAAPENIKKL